MENNVDRAAWATGIIIILLVLAALWIWLNKSAPATIIEEDPPVAQATVTLPFVPSGERVLAAQPRSGSDVASVVAGLADGSTFSAFLVRSGVIKSLKGPGPYTVFVPRNVAFARLPEGMLAMSPEAQKRFVQYHIVVGRSINIDELKSASIVALSKDILNFSVDDGKIARVDNSIIITQYKAKNGIVYLIDAPLFPPKMP